MDFSFLPQQLVELRTEEVQILNSAKSKDALQAHIENLGSLTDPARTRLMKIIEISEPIAEALNFDTRSDRSAPHGKYIWGILKLVIEVNSDSVDSNDYPNLPWIIY